MLLISAPVVAGLLTDGVRRNRVECADIFGLLATLPDHSVDMILADLPYGTTACSWDEVIPFEPMWAAFKRVIKPRGAIVLTASQPFTSRLVCSNLSMFRYEWVWEKSMPSNFVNANRHPMKYHENILVFYAEQPVFNRQLMERSDAGKQRLKTSGSILSGAKQSNHISTNISNNGARRFYDINLINPKSVLVFGSEPNNNGTKLHPTQKPVALFEYLIRTYTRPGDLVVDPVVGSGTTAVAARNTGRDYIVGDRDAGYVQIARERLRLPFEPHHVKRETRLDDLPMFAQMADG